MAHAPWIVAIENRGRNAVPWIEVAPPASPIANALTTPEAPLEPIALSAANPSVEAPAPVVDEWAKEMWLAYMEGSDTDTEPKEIDEMWLAYKEAMNEPTPLPQRPNFTPIPQTPGRVFNPTWTETTDSYDNVTQKTLYLGFTALGASHPEFAE